MTYRQTKIFGMSAVLIAGFAIATLGFLTGALGFGLSLALCFIVWIGGAAAVNRDRISKEQPPIIHRS